MLLTNDMVLRELSFYASPKSKLTRMIKEGKIFHICRGVYCTEREEPRLPVATMIMEQSYISFETALSYHGLIAEPPKEILSAGFLLKRNRRFSTYLGTYTFLYTPSKTFALALSTGREGGYKFPIATAEKALCDLLYRQQPIRTVQGIGELLEERLRIPKEKLRDLDWGCISMVAPLYHNPTCHMLLAWRERDGAVSQNTATLSAETTARI